MKKIRLIIISIVLLVAVVFVFASCSSAAPTQRIINSSVPYSSNVSSLTEVNVYNVYSRITNTDGTVIRGEKIGTMTYTFSKLDGTTTVTIGETEYKQQVGYYISTHVVGDYNNDKEVFFECLADTNLKTITSYTKKTSSDESWVSEKLTYETKNANRLHEDSNGNIEETSIKVGKGYSSEAFYDNGLMYTVARALPTTTSSFTFKVISFDENKTLSVALSRLSQTDILNDIDLYGTATTENCVRYTFTVTRTATPGNGSPMEVYTKSIISNEKLIENAIIKIIEGNIEYSLASSTIS